MQQFIFERQVLIETYWNVNLYHPLVVLRRACVLIETDWNVNIFSVALHYRHFVLIETCWNVNSLRLQLQFF